MGGGGSWERFTRLARKLQRSFGRLFRQAPTIGKDDFVLAEMANFRAALCGCSRSMASGAHLRDARLAIASSTVRE